jgi:pimeloyl-ACP methyl ester carboxylesterase
VTATSATTGLVLVHGAELGAWIWDEVVAALRHPAVAVDLPGRGTRPARGRDVRLRDAVDAVVADATTLGTDRVVLVAHSFSGILVPPAAHRLGDRVAAAVFLGATVPVEGCSWAELLPWPQRALFEILARVRPDGVLSPAGANRTSLCHDLDAATTERVIRDRVPEPPRVLLDPVSPAALPRGVTPHVVRLTDDRAVTEAARDASEARLQGALRHEVHSGHLPMLGHPGHLAALLTEIAGEATSGSPG